jgi:hypothetical protein
VSATFGPLDAQPVAKGMQTTRAARVAAVVAASRAELLLVFKEDLLCNSYPDRSSSVI